MLAHAIIPHSAGRDELGAGQILMCSTSPAFRSSLPTLCFLSWEDFRSAKAHPFAERRRPYFRVIFLHALKQPWYRAIRFRSDNQFEDSCLNHHADSGIVAVGVNLASRWMSLRTRTSNALVRPGRVGPRPDQLGAGSTVKPACWATRTALRSSVAISHPRDSARATHIASPSERNRLA